MLTPYKTTCEKHMNLLIAKSAGICLFLQFTESEIVFQHKSMSEFFYPATLGQREG
jgi:hypothetical protein